MNILTCPICHSGNTSLFLNLGDQPPANYLTLDKLAAIEAKKYNLSLGICNVCLYVWLNERVPPEVLFSQNIYLTGISSETRSDMQDFANDCIMTCNLVRSSKVLDIASNDGTLLSFFKDEGMEVFGIDPSEPAHNLAKAKGIAVINDFFNAGTAETILTTFKKMDIITATNVITHVDNPMEFLINCKQILKSDGTLVIEFYNFESIISNNAFDQTYKQTLHIPRERLYFFASIAASLSRVR